MDFKWDNVETKWVPDEIGNQVPEVLIYGPPAQQGTYTSDQSSPVWATRRARYVFICTQVYSPSPSATGIQVAIVSQRPDGKIADPWVPILTWDLDYQALLSSGITTANVGFVIGPGVQTTGVTDLRTWLGSVVPWNGGIVAAASVPVPPGLKVYVHHKDSWGYIYEFIGYRVY